MHVNVSRSGVCMSEYIERHGDFYMQLAASEDPLYSFFLAIDHYELLLAKIY